MTRIPAPGPGNLSISGRVTGQGSTVAGVKVELSGEKKATAITDSLGNYEFQSLGKGLYAISPSKEGFTFTPEKIHVELSETSISDKNFSISPLAPRLILIKKSLDFGEVALGATKRLQLGLSNLGPAPLNISSLSFSTSALIRSGSRLNE